MYESPIEKVFGDIQAQIIKQDEENIIYAVKQAVGYPIDKNELIKALKYDREQYEKGYRDGLNADKWIPVSERLPEEREWYLAIFKEKDTGYQLIPRVADYIGNGENKWRVIDEEGLCQEYRDILECVAWMPLPKPFEPQESEE